MVALAALALAPGAAAQETHTLLAAGDIADCVGPGDEATAAILLAREGTVATLGDNAQGSGSHDEFTRCYHPSWGQVLNRTKPSIGNHEYRTPGAAGYWWYFGAQAGEVGKGWYSYDLGAWHVVALNSNCSVVGCFRGSEQEAWLRADLAASTADCTLAYWHHSRFSSGRYNQLTGTEPLWQTLYEHGADLILTGHDHIYERHAPQTPIGDARDDYGIRAFIVGTGGHSHVPVREPRRPTSEIANDDTFGVLELKLQPGGYDWEFLAEAGRTFTDAGRGSCHGAPPDGAVPTAALTAPGDGRVVRGAATLAAAAGDNGTLARVDFLVSNVVVARDTTAPYEVQWDSAGFRDGVRSVVARAVDAFGNSTSSAPRTVIVDNALPETTLSRTPAADWRLRTATFAFGSEPGAAFDCALDAGAFSPCTSPVRYSGLSPGRHVFRVRARDAVRNIDPTPARHAWRVDVQAPATSLVFSSTARGPLGDATFVFRSSESRSTFTCSIDGAPWQACTSPVALAGVGAGRHRFRVRAADAAGNVDWAAATRSWTVTRGATGVTITGGPRAEILTGSTGDDVIDGGGGADVIRALAGHDAIRGGSGADRLDGGGGNDRLSGGAGADRLVGRSGRDFLDARDRTRDLISGGPGRDRALFDRRLDVVRAVERRR